MQNTKVASRSNALALSFVIGLVAMLAAIIGMIVDQTGGNSLASHVEQLYRPHGLEADPTLLWIILYSVFVAGAVCWAVALRKSLYASRNTKLWSSIFFVTGSSVLGFLAVVSEYDSPILPLTWRIVCGAIAAFGVVSILIAWLPTNHKIRH